MKNRVPAQAGNFRPPEETFKDHIYDEGGTYAVEMRAFAERGDEILLKGGTLHSPRVTKQLCDHAFKLWQHRRDRQFELPRNVCAYCCIKDMDPVREVSVSFPLRCEFAQ